MPTLSANRTLSKSDFKTARECPTKLYYRELGYASKKDDDEYLALLAEGGYVVEQMAKLRYPAGITLPYGGDPTVAASLTHTHLSKNTATLFEATLLTGMKLARVDILEKHGGVARLVEVKAKSFDSAANTARLVKGQPSIFRSTRKPFGIMSEWQPYLEDVTFQVLLLEEVLPGTVIEPFLCLVDKSKTAQLDGLPGFFEVERRTDAAGRERVHTARFIGTPEQAELLRRENVLVEVDVSQEVAVLRSEVAAAVSSFVASLQGGPAKIAVPIGWACRDCDYRLPHGNPAQANGFRECWGPLADVQPSILTLHKGGLVRDATGSPLIDGLVASGRASLFDVPDAFLRKADGTVGATAQRQLIQLGHTRANSVWIGDGLRPVLQDVSYPLHFIDFETSRMALPYHAGMRPYGLIAFQWSCHTQQEPGGPLEHREWLSDAPGWPNADFAGALRAAIGESGTVLTWSQFEQTTLRQVAEELAAFGRYDAGLVNWIDRLSDKGGSRVVDMNQMTIDSFFHPGMGGRSSIKVVLDALWKSDDAMRQQFAEWTGRVGDPKTGPYAALPELVINGRPQAVAEGTGAMRAYEAMTIGVESRDPATRATWRELLLQYCELDTLAMVMIWEYWMRQTGLA